MTKVDLNGKKKIHFIGIGGIGMSGIASVLLEMGHKISGSDLKDNNLLKELKFKGADIFIGHRDSNLKKDTDFVVYTSCIRKDNPEMSKANLLNIPIVHRQGVLAALMKNKKGIAVTGAHGKSTTTALIGTILFEAGLDPTLVVGAEVFNFGSNARLGKSDFLVIEADESDGSLVELEPYYAVITNIDREHLDYYKGIDNLIRTNRVFIERIKQKGCLFCLYGDKNIAKLLKGYNKEYKTFGFSQKADIYPTDIKIEELATSFKCIYKNKGLGTFKIMPPGRHNVLNALASISVALDIGIELPIVQNALLSYKGAKRRFEIKGTHRGIIVIEDYAHHPREIEATLKACREWNRGRIISIFQPHRFSRTKLLADEFAKVFKKLTDELILTDIYSAHEDPIKNVSSELIFDKLKGNNNDRACLLPKKDIVKYLNSRIKKDDIILVLGAGDIGEISSQIVDMLKTS